MAGAMALLEDSYITDVAITERYLFVCVSASGDQHVTLPSTAAMAKQIVGIAQTTSKINEPVLVRRLGKSFLKCDGAIARAARVQAQTVTNLGRGLTLADPAAPAGAGGTYAAADTNAVATYVTNLITTLETTAAVADTTGTAAGDLIVVNLGGGKTTLA